ncbi:helix-turn-helix domain-containing protein [Agromyces sp. NPDC058064]|uniref:helix-turn-helix domain-containing protein n=1 Tax=Agromyces sp. NPDC058064 TaxID=3346322 RepID=UPI0036DB0E35
MTNDARSEASAPGPVLVRHPVRPELAGLVAGVVGHHELVDRPVVRRQVAGSLIPLVLSFGTPLDVLDLSAGEGRGRRTSFVAGIMPGHATTSFEHEQHCLQVYLTPLGVVRLLGLPGRELAARVVDLADAAPAFDDRFVERLLEARTWPRRFELVDRVLLDLLGHGRPVEPFVGWMWRQIERSGGRARIGELVEQTGWSQRHATARFTEEVGIRPKTAASIVRFERALAELRDRPAAEVAAAAGFADQSHLVREFRRFAGWTPTELLRTEPTTAQAAIG